MAAPHGQSTSPVGTWKVTSFHIAFEGSDERIELYGAHPLGHVVLTEERLIAVITRLTGPSMQPPATCSGR